MTIILDGTNGISAENIQGIVNLAVTGNTTLGDASADQVTINGNTINIAASGARITGDFSNATRSNRVMFQTSTLNDSTLVKAIPNGTATTSAFQVGNNSTPDNQSQGAFAAGLDSIRIASEIVGSGTYLPMTFYTGGAERLRIDATGKVLATGVGLGYGTGAGGTVTQLTSKSTAVTLNKASGQITMNNAALAAGAFVEFQLNNSLISTTDVVFANITGAFTGYRLETKFVQSGLCQFRLTNISAGSLSEAVVFNYVIIKGSTS